MQKLVKKKQLRKFCFLIGVGLPILVGWVHPAITGHMFRFWTLWFGISSFLLGIFVAFNVMNKNAFKDLKGYAKKWHKYKHKEEEMQTEQAGKV